jgi:PAS domain S-box-containing protein
MLLEQGRVRDFEAQFRKKSGEIGTLLVSAEVINLAGERYMLSLMHDITERKRAEEALRQREREFSTLAENATDMIVRFDTDLRHVYCNAAVELQLGVPASTFIGKTPLETGGPREQAEFIDKSLRQVLETGQEQEVEQSYPTPSGSKHFLTRIVPERDEQGKIESLLAITRDITERKQAETELHFALEKYRVLFESFPLGISVTDAAGILIEVNRESERLLGIPLDEHTRRKFDGPEWRIVRPDGTPMPPDEYASVRALREKRLVEDVEMGIVKDGGEITWISVTAAPIPLEGYGVAIAYGDITERKRAEEALKESESLLREAQAAAHIGHWAINPSIMIPTWSEEIFHIFGLDPKKSAPSFAMHQTITHPDDWDILNNAVTTSIVDGTPFNIEFRIIRQDKAIRWMHAIGYPRKTSKGRTESLFGTAQDITERKRAEEALRESEGRFRLLYEKAPLGYQSLDAAGCFIDVNQAWLDTLGYSREEVIGRWFGDFLAPHEVEAFKQRFPKFKGTGEIQVEVETVRKDGAHAIIAIVGRIAYDEHGGFKQTHCILTDITERKRVEDALRENRARLARLSRRLVDAQEQERRRIARELHDEVGQNLTALTISLDGVSQLAMDGVMRGKITEIQELTKHLIVEVNALSVELRPRVLDDLGLIPGLLSLFSRFSTQTGVEIDFKHTGIERKRLAPELEISAYRIIQEALTNVVRHAGVKTARVRLQGKDDILWIQVQDEGKGFEFQQAMNAEDSMGLLSMTERAEQVGGKLEVQTAPGEGTLITCRLPLGGSHIE